MALATITSSNRGAAKKILSTWTPAATVRTWTLAELAAALQRAISQGLITEAGINRALGAENERQQGMSSARTTGDGSTADDDDAKGETQKGEDDDSESGANGTTESEASEDASDASTSESKSSDSEQGEDSETGSGDNGNDASGESEQGESEDGSESEDDAKQQDSESERDSSEDDAQSENEDAQSEDDNAQEDDGPLAHHMLPTVLKWLKSGANVALVGPAGTGKSTIVKQCAEILDRNFYACGALMSKFELIGFNDANGVYQKTPLFDAYTQARGLFCFDELDASSPEAVVAFNAITDNQNVYAFPNGMHAKHPDFLAVCCMNTFGNGATANYVGRYKQDGASMSRFVRIYIDYDRKLEARFGSPDICQRVWDLRDACTNLGLIQHIVSSRMIVFAEAGRRAGLQKHEIDRDVFFSGLDDATLKQVKAEMSKIAKARAAQ